ncbi:MAG: hypothetical protein MJZ65_02965 [Paludibacteraceae bacterium]|nr:hypothetical protein [Paludibacteraceae bacterium]
MKKCLPFLLSIMACVSVWAVDARMFTWQIHLAYGSVRQIVDVGDRIYGLAGNAVFYVDKQTEEVTTLSKLDGLNGSDVAQIGYDASAKTFVIVYEDGLVDFIKGSTIYPMTDLLQKDMAATKKTNQMLIEGDTAYLAMPFGLMTIQVDKRQIGETYYIGANGSEVNLIGVAVTKDSIFAVDDQTLYSVSRGDNAMDYMNWQRRTLPSSVSYVGVGVYQDTLYALRRHVYKRKAQGHTDEDSVMISLGKQFRGEWQIIEENHYYRRLIARNGELYVGVNSNGCYQLTPSGIIYRDAPAPVYDVLEQSNTMWTALGDYGLFRQANGESQLFNVDGPLLNLPYRLKIANQKLYMVPGSRWSSEDKRPGNIMIYDINNDRWTNISADDIIQQTDGMPITDIMNIAVDPFDAEHFFATSYGNGILEFYQNKLVKRYTYFNSPLLSAAPGAHEDYYVRTDGALFDEMGNLWALNTEVDSPVHVANPGQIQAAHSAERATWSVLPLGGKRLYAPGEMFIDNRHSNWKWIFNSRSEPRIFLLDDGGTPQNIQDDDIVSRPSFVDQDGKTVSLSVIYAMTQDKDGALWVALETGLITIPATVDFKQSNACERIKIPRNDGTNLADYLLETEKINTIVVDGANRKWIGTEASGLYLMSADGLETIEHFTTDNSPLLSNTIISIAIEPITGKVFIGTAKGLMSYQSDAAAPFEDYATIYAYPNPVRPDYFGPITISGLMDNSEVHIVDNAGNVVCATHSNGGLAIWDGKTADGKRVASGVYSVFCNESSDNKHTVVKILVMH